MTLMIAMRKVKACDVHPTVHENRQGLLTPTGRSKRTNDLGTTVRRVCLGLDTIETNLASVKGRDDAGVGNHDATKEREGQRERTIW